MSDEVKDKSKAPPGSLAQPVKLSSKLNSFHKQVIQGAAEAGKIANAVNPTTTYADMSSTVIFPDCSGSMSDVVGNNDPHDKSFFCRQAVNTFLDNCFPGATKVGLASFPELVVLEPTHDLNAVRVAAQAIEPIGSTPMDEALEFVVNEWPCTHGIVVSDGSPDDKSSVLEVAKQYRAKSIKIDAVHIGEDHGGEELMKQLAEITGGIYIKFTDVKTFATSFKYLTPQHRLTLTTSKNPVALLGAAEVKI